MLLIETSELLQSVGFAITDAEEGTERIKKVTTDMVTAILKDGTPISIEDQQAVHTSVKNQLDRLEKLNELKQYVKFAEDSNVAVVHLSVEMFSLIKYNLPAR
jgi:thiamine biosynthesis lipoprotein ApbE